MSSSSFHLERSTSHGVLKTSNDEFVAGTLLRSSTTTTTSLLLPPQVGSSGPIFSLVHRDVQHQEIVPPAPAASVAQAKNPVKLGRLMMGSRRGFRDDQHRYNQHDQQMELKEVSEVMGKDKHKLPKWKRFLNRLLGGGGGGGGNGNSSSRAPVVRHSSGTVQVQQVSSHTQLPRAGKKPPLWERRNFGQIYALEHIRRRPA